jgi:hypothetical protein
MLWLLQIVNLQDQVLHQRDEILKVSPPSFLSHLRPHVAEMAWWHGKCSCASIRDSIFATIWLFAEPGGGAMRWLCRGSVPAVVLISG